MWGSAVRPVVWHHDILSSDGCLQPFPDPTVHCKPPVNALLISQKVAQVFRSALTVDMCTSPDEIAPEHATSSHGNLPAKSRHMKAINNREVFYDSAFTIELKNTNFWYLHLEHSDPELEPQR
jgi:hypothetical protein